METNTEITHEHPQIPPAPAPRYMRPWRWLFAMTITKEEREAFKIAARSERLAVCNWLRRLALAELKRKRIKIPK